MQQGWEGRGEEGHIISIIIKTNNLVCISS